MGEGALVRTRNDRWIAGVCGGLARWLGWDSTAVRMFCCPYCRRRFRGSLCTSYSRW